MTSAPQAIERVRAEVQLAEETCHFLVKVDTYDLRLILTNQGEKA